MYKNSCGFKEDKVIKINLKMSEKWSEDENGDVG